jgi:hypothetical protein
MVKIENYQRMKKYYHSLYYYIKFRMLRYDLIFFFCYLTADVYNKLHYITNI